MTWKTRDNPQLKPGSPPGAASRRRCSSRAAIEEARATPSPRPPFGRRTSSGSAWRPCASSACRTDAPPSRCATHRGLSISCSARFFENVLVLPAWNALPVARRAFRFQQFSGGVRRITPASSCDRRNGCRSVISQLACWQDSDRHSSAVSETKLRPAEIIIRLCLRAHRLRQRHRNASIYRKSSTFFCRSTDWQQPRTLLRPCLERIPGLAARHSASRPHPNCYCYLVCDD